MTQMPLSRRMRESLGVTIAVWFHEATPRQQILGFLRQALDDMELFVQPEHISVVIDGCHAAIAPAHEAVQELQQRSRCWPSVHVKEENEGQGGAVAYGVERLLAETDVEYICTRDVDGDHDVYDMPQMYRRLLEIESHEGTDHVYVIGGRSNRHRPMGYARGELEGALNEVTVQSLTAVGKPPQLKYCRLYEGHPDFQSGFKIYTRWSAGVTATSLREAHAREPQLQPLRWGVQFISTVELLSRGAIPASVCRLTYDEQPQSTFEGYDDLPVAYGQQIAWLCRRLELAPEVAWPVIDASLAGTLFATVPEGWDTVLALRQCIARDAWGSAPPPVFRRGAMF